MPDRNRGNASWRKGEHGKAIADYSEAIRLNPSDAIAYNSRGSAYRETRELDNSIADYNEAIRLDPKYTIAYNNRGKAYEQKGENDKAIADFTEAIRLDPKRACRTSTAVWPTEEGQARRKRIPQAEKLGLSPNQRQ